MTRDAPTRPSAPSRRAFLRRAARIAGGVAAVALFGAMAVVRTSGYAVDLERARRLRALAPWQLAVVDAVASRICAADVPYDAPGAPPTPREAGVAEHFDAYLAAAHPAIRRDVLACVGLVEHAWPLVAGKRRRFTALARADQDDVLASMESSSIGVVRGAFQALKALVMMGYWRDPRTWGVIGYDGPLVDRPPRGWTPPSFVPLGSILGRDARSEGQGDGAGER